MLTYSQFDPQKENGGGGGGGGGILIKAQTACVQKVGLEMSFILAAIFVFLSLYSFVTDTKFHGIPWNSMELLLSSKSAHY